MAKGFHAELKSLRIHLPGNHVTTFSDTDALRNFFHHQYPTWKVAGTVTSIPAGRVPRLFLTGDQVTADFRKQMATLQKGETGEIDVYTSLLNTTKGLKDGILIFPNVDGNIFKSKVARVELDIVVVHPRKGAFVFNIKNAKNVMEKKLCEDMVKHTNFIRLIQTIGEGAHKVGNLMVPVHGVICSLQKTVAKSVLKINGFFDSALDNEKRFIIQPHDMGNFSETWLSILSQVPNLPDNYFDSVDVLAMRLGTLNSMEGSVAMIHKQLSSNHLQTMERKEKDGKRILGDSISETLPSGSNATEIQDVDLLREELIALQTSASKGEKVSFILWTKEQQKIITDIGMALLGSTKTCRMIITGPKGSGKTMLLIYIARLAKKIFQSQGKDIDGNVAIIDGRGNSQLLFENLKTDFEGSGISVDTGEWIESVDRGEWIENEKRKRRGLMDKKLLLFDECILKTLDSVLASVQVEQHVILFSSLKPSVLAKQNKKLRSSYRIFKIKSSLRSTCEISEFVESFRALDPSSGECKVNAAHNLRGAAPIIRSISIDEKSDPLHTSYIHAVVDMLGQTLQRSHGLKHILVTPFVHQITLQRIISEIQKNGWEYEYRNPADFHAKLTMWDLETDENDKPRGRINPKRINERALPLITFTTGNHVDGAEYGAVIVLLERSLPHYWEWYIHASLFIAMTRASTILAFIVNNTIKPPLIQHKFETPNETAIPKLWKRSIMPEDTNIAAYTFVECGPNEFYHNLVRIIRVGSWSNSPVLVLGQHECLGAFDEIEQPKDSLVEERRFSDEIKWYKVEGKVVVHARKYVSSLRFFDQRIYMDSWNIGFSALVFLIASPEDYEEMSSTVRRHALLYYMHEEQLGNCPIYTLASLFLHDCWALFQRSPSILSICDFLISNCTRQGEEMSHDDLNLDSNQEPVIVSCKALKELGNGLFKAGNLEAALSKYTESYKKLRAEFYSSLQSVDIDILIDIQDELSKLCTNISKIHFDLASSTNSGLDIQKMELSLQYAVESVELDPYWIKGYHRISEAKQMLGGERWNVPDLNQKKIYISRVDSSMQYETKRNIVLDKKMKNSNSWELVRFKGNAYLVDKNGQGHFKSISEALNCKLFRFEGKAYLVDKNGRGLFKSLLEGRNCNEKKGTSLLINPGVYEEHAPIVIGGVVDFFGNFEPEICKTNQWILDDPPVVIQSSSYRTIWSMSSEVFLSRVSIYNWSTDGGSAVFSSTTSRVSLYQCGFKSMCGAAVHGRDGSNLSIKFCRAVDTSGAVLAGDRNTTVTVSHSFIRRTKMIALEFREDVSVDINHCSISQCELTGITCLRGVIVIKSCVLDTNATKLTINEGAIMVRQSTATIENTKIMNQVGCGITIEYGSGTFNDVTVNRCRGSGFSINAPCVLTTCKVTNCLYGFIIDNNFKGEVILEKCDVTRCNKQIVRCWNATKPIIKGNPLKCHDRRRSFKSNTRAPSINEGRRVHERSLILRKFLSTEESIISARVRMDTRIKFGCAYCTTVPYKDKYKCFLCKNCDSLLYCSIDCWNKDKNKDEGHRCTEVQLDIRAYREWQSTCGKGSEASDDGDMKCYDDEVIVDGVSIRKGEKYRGPADALLEEKYLREDFTDNENSYSNSANASAEVGERNKLCDETDGPESLLVATAVDEGHLGEKLGNKKTKPKRKKKVKKMRK